MTSLYGHRWTSAYGDHVDPDGVWERALTGIDKIAIGRAFSHLATQTGEPWPPSAPEFRQLCEGEKGHDTWQQRKYKAAEEVPKLLPEKRTEETKQRVSNGIAELRKGLK